MSAACPLLLRLSIALIAAAGLAYEVLLMRWFSMIQWHHFAFMIISFALLGFGASGAFLSFFSTRLQQYFPTALISSLLLFGLSATGAIVLAQRIPFNPEELLWNWRQIAYLFSIYLVLVFPFFFAASSIGLTLAKYRQGILGIYAANLVGSGVGSFGALILLFYLFPEKAVILLSLMGVVAAAISWWALKRESTGC